MLAWPSRVFKTPHSPIKSPAGYSPSRYSDSDEYEQELELTRRAKLAGRSGRTKREKSYGKNELIQMKMRKQRNEGEFRKSPKRERKKLTLPQQTSLDSQVKFLSESLDEHLTFENGQLY